MSNVKAFDPSAQARCDPYYKRNHMGHVVCTLCDVRCSDDNNFIKHLSGKTHRLQLERLERGANREKRLAEEEELNKEAKRRAEQEKATRELLLQQAAASQTAVTSFAPFGRPEYHYCTEHDPEVFQTKVWLEFYFPQAVEGTRPLHRWRSAREQDVERPINDDVVYLLVACEGYMTVGLKFPAKLHRTTGRAAGVGEGDGSGGYRCHWDPVKRVYELFFILG
uniref:Uncharacterized protein n=1 Tax=Trypanosoma congolense (strain IL3000) TaxID=1068625 RepID=G0UJ98_TRYCI|nr:conserved hypothetical protein [Trypanosoma congolense IL3000]